MLQPWSRCSELFGQRIQVARPVTRRIAANLSAARLTTKQPPRTGRVTGWQQGSIQHQKFFARDLCCRAESSSLDIEYIHPPREGKLESENLRSNVRKQVSALVADCSRSIGMQVAMQAQGAY